MNKKRGVAIIALVIAIALCASAFAFAPQSTSAANDTTPTNISSLAIEDRFSDVSSDAWYAEAVTYVADNGIMTGTSAAEFSPEATTTRAMTATILHRIEDTPEAGPNSFLDVEDEMWYTDAISWAEENDIVSGYGGGIFGTHDSITREQLVTILWRYVGSPDAGTAAEDFSDYGSISDYARQGVSWAVEQGVVNGKPGNIFDPAGNATRAEVATILYNYLSDGKIDPSPEPSPPVDGTESTVFFTSDISPEGLMAIYEALGVDLTGNVAVKVHTGEPGGQNFLRPEFMQELVQSLDGTIVESNTAYGGARASTAMHYQVARDHGFNDIADVVILDEEDSMALPVTGGTHLSENLVGARLAEFDSLLCLSHFKGHAIGGYGGAMKNMSIGIASTTGKNRIHTAGTSEVTAGASGMKPGVVPEASIAPQPAQPVQGEPSAQVPPQPRPLV